MTPLEPDDENTKISSKKSKSFRFKKFLIPAGILLLKAKSIFSFLKIFIVAKTGLSVLVFVCVEAYLFGWLAAGALFVLLLSMSAGRWVILRLQKRTVQPLVLLPLIGGGVGSKEPGETAAHDAWVGLSGPIMSGLLSIAALVIYLQGGTRFWPVMSLLGLSITLFQLAPAPFLSGGSVALATFPKLHLPCIVMMIAVAPTSVIVWILGIMSFLPALHHWKHPLPNIPYFVNVAVRSKIIIGITWILCILTVAAAYRITSAELDVLTRSGL